MGTRRSLDASGAGRFTSAYDLAGQVISLRNPYGERTTFSYDEAGRRTVQRNANGTRVSTVYDAASQTTQVIHRTSGGTSLLQLDYRYDNAGNRNGMIENGGTARTTWSYDPQNQLTGEFRTGTNAYRQTFTFDPAGNRTLKNIDGARTTYAYDPANQLKYGQAAAGRTTFQYDLTGNQQIEQPPTGNRTTTTWNYENQPTQYLLPSGAPVTMAYNGDNRRVLKQQGSDTTKFVWDSVIDAYVSELDGSNVLIATYTNEPQQYGAVVSQRRGSTSHILHADALGTTRLLTDNTQTVTDMYLYDAWGNLITSSGATVNPFRWVGRYGYYWDEELSQYHVRARPYTPATGQWSTQDPAGFVDGLNMHLYVHNYPVNLTDPSGRLFGYGYGNFCGYSRKACCPPGSSKVKPIDAVDAACERHDCCVATILDLWKWTSCSAELCTEVWDAFYGGCAQSYPGNPAKINACKQAATAVGSLFCWLAPGVDPPVGGVSPG